MVALSKTIFPKGTIVTFVANGKQEKFELLEAGTVEKIRESIEEIFEAYREESLCLNGINVMYPFIKSGYAIVDGDLSERLINQGKQTYFPLNNVQYIMKLGMRKGDTLNLKGISSFIVTDVNYGERMLAISLE